MYKMSDYLAEGNKACFRYDGSKMFSKMTMLPPLNKFSSIYEKQSL